MKKLLALILAVCVIFAVGISYLNYTDRDQVIAQYEQTLPLPNVGEEVPAAEEIPEDAVVETVEYKGLDLEAVRSLHDGEQIVMSLNGQDISWADYYYCLSSQISQVEQIFQMMAMYYNQLGDWNDVADPNTGESYVEVVNFNAEAMLRQMLAIEQLADELGVELDEEALASIEEQKAADKLSLCGEDASDEDFTAALTKIGLNAGLYERITRLSVLYNGCHDALYGAEGEKVDEAEINAWLAEQGYMRANHILFMTIDQGTGEALEQSVIDEKLAQAKAVVAEIAAIEDEIERKTRFEELKVELCEDSGKEAYPEGYIFTSGTMVVEFEDTTLALEDYEVSQPVESKYGYHVLLRLPLEADADISTSSGSTTGRQLYTAEAYDKLVMEAMDKVEVVYAEGFEPVDLSAYLNK